MKPHICGVTLIVLALWSSVHGVHGSRILLHTCHGCISHNYQVLEVAEELCRRGHEVKLLLADSDLALLERGLPPTLNTSLIVYHPYNDVEESVKRLQHFIKRLADPSSKDMMFMYYFFLDTCQRLLTDIDGMAEIKAFGPDLIIADILSQCAKTLIYKLEVPYVPFLFVGIAEPLMSAKFSYLAPPSMIPTIGTLRHPPMSFFERLQNWAEHTNERFMLYGQLLAGAHLRFNLGMPIVPKMPPPQLVLVNSAFPIEPPRALPDGIKFVGPLRAKPGRELRGDLVKIASGSAPVGFVYVSFGTTYGLFDATSLRTLAAALASLNCTVLWQVNEHTLPQNMTLKDLSLSPNVHPLAWAPQNDIIGSPHLALFITHGGLNAFSEALYHGVPMVVMPVMGDQHNHAVRAAALGIGLRVDRRSLARGGSRELVAAVKRILSDPSFKKRAMEAGALLRAHPVPPAVRAAEWVEAALAMPPGAGLPVSDPAASLWWFVRESHDVHLVLVVLVAAVVAVGRRAQQALRRSSTKRKGD